MTRTLPSIAAACCLIALCCGASQPAQPSAGAPSAGPAPSRRLLVVTHTAGFRHGSIPVAETTLQEIGEASGLYETEFCRTADDVGRLMTRAGLARFDGVFFANTTGNIGVPDLDAFLGWIAEGHAFLGAHSASDTYHESPAFLEMLGGEFLRHGSIVEADVLVDDPAHPAVAHLAPRFRITDELYRFTRNSRANVQVLLSLDRNPADGLPGAGEPADLPMAWHRTHGQGRVFYTAFGHRDEVWQDPRFRQHLREATRWALASVPARVSGR
ncbi:MAG TPA: ThuA domain-containing protein [Vicinamibacterales bacterium]|nr:ThuA domain-containing protein [Vicinamibacterales bacterium]